MPTKNLPRGYAIAYIEGKWYSLQAPRYYSADDPEGYIRFDYLDQDDLALGFATQREAISAAQRLAFEAERKECERWERLVSNSDVYPERCVHYRDIIKEATGREPLVLRGLNDVVVHMVSPSCSLYPMPISFLAVHAPTIEEALAEAAERAYADRCLCELAQDEHLRATA
jgi:hypothetical protein